MKTINDKDYKKFIDDMLCKQDNPFDYPKDPIPYQTYRRDSALIIDELHEKLKGSRLYQENKHEIWDIIKQAIMLHLYIQSLTPTK